MSLDSENDGVKSTLPTCLATGTTRQILLGLHLQDPDHHPDLKVSDDRQINEFDQDIGHDITETYNPLKLSVV